ncbi:hypothetical protein XENOCAPTIV_016917, partial [Xenoophorus captivus]
LLVTEFSFFHLEGTRTSESGSVCALQVSAYGFITRNYLDFSDHYYDSMPRPLRFYANHDLQLESRLRGKLDAFWNIQSGNVATFPAPCWSFPASLRWSLVDLKFRPLCEEGTSNHTLLVVLALRTCVKSQRPDADVQMWQMTRSSSSLRGFLLSGPSTRPIVLHSGSIT